MLAASNGQANTADIAAVLIPGPVVTPGPAAPTSATAKDGKADHIDLYTVNVTDHKPTDADVNRVRAKLAAGGWPLARPEHVS